MKVETMRNLMLLLFLFIGSFNYAQTDYYFSSSNGNDMNNGGESTPFKTIDKLNSLDLLPGDRVFFKRGDTFIGQIILQNESGAEGHPLSFDSYGDGVLPILSGSNGNNGIPDPRSTIRIIGSEYLEFQNLQIENERFDSNGINSDDDKSFGIYFQSFLALPPSGDFEDQTPYNHLEFRNINFQNIYSVNISGTAFNNLRSSGLHLFDGFVKDLIVENCHFTNLERVGIWCRKFIADVIVRNNTFIDIGGSGAIFSNCRRVLFENNLMRFCGSTSDSRMVGRGSGMWVFASDDVVAQFNTSQHARGGGDSSGMHVDYSNSNILFQYNYSEDSAGGFCEILGNNDNVIWRYNISVNDGTTEMGGKNNLLWVSDFAGANEIRSDKVYIYNNTIYQGRDYKNVNSDSKIQLEAINLNFYNNILYLEPNSKVGEASFIYNVRNANFGKNIMFGGSIINAFKNLDPTRIEQDAKLVDRGRRHDSGYKLLSSSPGNSESFNLEEPTFPLAGIGIFENITSKATFDYYGNPVDLNMPTNIGAYNGPGVVQSDEISSYEAENPVHSLNGGAAIINCENASGGQAVNFGADGRSITFNMIDLPPNDINTFLVIVHHASPFKTRLRYKVNNREEEVIILPANNAYCFENGGPTKFPILIDLDPGDNAITFQKGIFDKIDVIAINNLTTVNAENIQIEKKTLGYLENTLLEAGDSLIFHFTPEQYIGKSKIYIYDLSGNLIYSKNQIGSNSIVIDSSSLGLGMKVFVAYIKGKKVVNKFIIYK